VPPAVSVRRVGTGLTPQSIESFRPDVTHIGKSIAIKGEVSGSENVYLNGELEGSGIRSARLRYDCTGTTRLSE